MLEFFLKTKISIQLSSWTYMDQTEWCGSTCGVAHHVVCKVETDFKFVTLYTHAHRSVYNMCVRNKLTWALWWNFLLWQP